MYFSRFGRLLGRLGGLLGGFWALLWPYGTFWCQLKRFCGRLGALLGRLGDVLGSSWGVLGGLLGRLGGVLGGLGGLLGPPGGRDPPGARGIRFWGASWGRLGLHFRTFLDAFLDGISIIFLSYLEKIEHVVKPQNYYICNTGEAFQALHVRHFVNDFKQL